MRLRTSPVARAALGAAVPVAHGPPSLPLWGLRLARLAARLKQISATDFPVILARPKRVHGQTRVVVVAQHGHCGDRRHRCGARGQKRARMPHGQKEELPCRQQENRTYPEHDARVTSQGSVEPAPVNLDADRAGRGPDRSHWPACARVPRWHSPPAADGGRHGDLGARAVARFASSAWISARLVAQHGDVRVHRSITVCSRRLWQPSCFGNHH
jgi:hypothetical protein